MSHIPFQLRRDTAANWTANNSILREGEIGYETDDLGTATPLYKIGDGTTDWNSLPYVTSGGAGDVVGPASSVDSNVALFDGVTGKLLKDGGTLGTAAFDDTGDFDPAGSAAAAQAAAIAASDPVGSAAAAQAAATAASDPVGSAAAAQAASQPLDSDLTAIAGLSPANDDFIQRKAGAWANRTVAQIMSDLGLSGVNTGDKPVDIQTFAASGTWTKPAGVTSAHIICIGGGGGGGSGRKGAAGTIRCGGGSGAAGGRSAITMPATSLASTIAVTVGAGGAGGAARTTNDTNGANGATGGSSSFAGVLLAGGGGPGQGGTAVNGNAGGAGTGLLSAGAGGSAASATGGNGGSGGTAPYASTGGGSGGGITAADVRSAGGTARGGSGITFANHTDVSLPPGTFVNADAGVATNGSADTLNLLATGGGGSPSSLLTNASPGGNGGGYGAGGGGGGASLNSVGNSGAGGNGSDGYVMVISW